MKKSYIVVPLFIACAAIASYAADVPPLEFRSSIIPFSPEDPAMLLVGLGGVGVAAAYIRAKLKK